MPGILLGKLDVCGAIMIALESTSPTEAGDRLRSARGNADLAQQEAAEEISIASTTLVAIEKGLRRIRIDELCRLANYMGFQ